MKDQNNSFRNFPPDLAAAMGLPIVVVAVATSWLLSLRGWPWVIAYCGALLLSGLGACFLFRAKLPLYRQRRFFTFGCRELPDSSIPWYRWGWRLSFLGITLAVLLLAMSVLWG